jgi:MraZ protein
MDQFVSTFTNRIDTKGRVSVPASFRTVLAKDGLDGIYCYPSLDAPALDAGGKRLVDKINALVEDLAPYSDEKDQLATALFGTSEILTIDQDGRTILPERLREHAGITSHITFVDQREIPDVGAGRFEARGGAPESATFASCAGAPRKRARLTGMMAGRGSSAAVGGPARHSVMLGVLPRLTWTARSSLTDLRRWRLAKPFSPADRKSSPSTAI